MKIICLSTESVWTKQELKILRKFGKFVQISRFPENEDELVRLLEDADYAVVAPMSFGSFSKKIIESLPKLKGISIVTTRYVWVDIDSAKAKGLVVSNLPGYSTTAVAELAIGLMLDLAKKITRSVDSTRKGNRTFEGFEGFELKGKTLGIIGLGSIGRRIGSLGECLGMEVIGWNRTRRQDKIKQVELDNLLENSDIVSMNLALNSETKLFLNKEGLSKLKSSAVIINVSPEDLIDQNTVYKMLVSEKLAGYGYEVDKGRTYPIQEKLLKLDNVIATSHIGWCTKEAQQRVKNITIENLEAMVRGKPINNVAI